MTSGLPPLDRDQAKALAKRAKRALDRLARYAPLMRACSDLALPERNILAGQAEGQERSQRIYDSTAPIGVSRFANRLVQAMFPPQQQWAELRRGRRARHIARAEARRIDARLQEATAIIFEHIRESNFDQAIVEAAHDLAVGTALLLVEPGQVRGRFHAPLLRFEALPAGAIALENGPFGTVELAAHPMRMPARDLPRRWPDARPPDDLARRLAQDPDGEIELLHVIAYEPEAMLWRIAVLWQTEQVVVDRAARTSPLVAIRWLTVPGEVYGRGPLVQALPDIRTVNKTKELLLQNAALAVAGVYTARDDGVLNPYTVKLVPGAIIPVMSNGAGGLGPSLAPLERPGDVNLSQFVIEDLQRAIRTVLFDNPLPPEIRSNVSATEIAERMSLFAADTGSFGRLHADGVAPLMWRVIDLLDQAGELPGLLALRESEDIRVVATSPLAQMQDMADVQAVLRYVQLAAVFEQFAPGFARAGLALDRVAAWLAQRLNVPAELVPSTEERAAETERAQAAQAAQLIAASPVAARVADNLTKPFAAATGS